MNLAISFSPSFKIFSASSLALALSAAVLAQPATGPARRGDRFDQGPKPGSAAPDFALPTIEGKTLLASALWSNLPTVVMAGCHTCPIFRGKVEPFEKLVTDYSNRVHFVILYTLEAHPKGDLSPYRGVEWVTPANERDGILMPQPKTTDERAQRAQACASAMKLTVPVVVDKMDNAVWKAYGGAPNSAYLVGRNGKIIEQEGWFDPARMRAAIERALHDGKPAPAKAKSKL